MDNDTLKHTVIQRALHCKTKKLNLFEQIKVHLAVEVNSIAQQELVFGFDADLQLLVALLLRVMSSVCASVCASVCSSLCASVRVFVSVSNRGSTAQQLPARCK